MFLKEQILETAYEDERDMCHCGGDVKKCNFIQKRPKNTYIIT